MKKRLNRTYHLRKDPGSRDNEEDVPFTVNCTPGERDNGAEDMQSGSDGKAKPHHAVRPKQEIVAWMKVSGHVTAFSRPKSVTPVVEKSQGMMNESAKSSTPVRAKTPVKPSTSVKANFK